MYLTRKLKVNCIKEEKEMGCVSLLGIPSGKVLVAVIFIVLSVLLPGAFSSSESETAFFDNLTDGKRKEIEGRDSVRQIIYCNFVRLGEGKPPLLSHIRVSRGPSSQEISGGLIGGGSGGGSSTGRIRVMKPPSYQHKMLHTLSQFHGNNAPSFYDRYGQYMSHNPIYPVTSVQMVRRPPGHNNHHIEQIPPEMTMNENTEDPNMDLFQQGLGENPTFSPYIGPRALSSIPEFFTHIRDNLDALRELERQEEAQESLHKLNGVKINEFQHQHKDLPMRRGDYFNTDGRLSINSDEYGYSYDGNNEDKVSGGGRIDDPTKNHGSQAEEATSDLLKYMGQDPKYKKANGHNPSFLFTGLGLGKRSRG